MEDGECENLINMKQVSKSVDMALVDPCHVCKEKGTAKFS